MANSKKIVPEEKTETTVKAANVKAETAASAVKKDEPAKAEKKRPGRKPAASKATAEKATAAKEEKIPAAKKDEPAKTEKKRPGRKPAASKAAAEKATAAKEEKTPAAKKDEPAKTEKKRPGRKPAASKATAEKATAAKEGKAPAKRGGRKKAVTLNNVVEATRKNITGAYLSKIKYPIAVNVELNGSANGIFYIFVSDGKIAVEPYKYDDYDVYIRADADEFMNVINGKKNIYDALADGLIKIDGNTKKAILFINAVM